jgi:hypothetical protein
MTDTGGRSATARTGGYSGKADITFVAPNWPPVDCLWLACPFLLALNVRPLEENRQKKFRCFLRLTMSFQTWMQFDGQFRSTLNVL